MWTEPSVAGDTSSADDDCDVQGGTAMSTTDPTRPQATVRQYEGAPEPYDRAFDDGAGWVTFAAVMLLLLAALNIIDGIAAVSDSTFFTENAKFVFSNLNTWGWILIVCGVGQGLVGLGVWVRTSGVRWIGVAIAAANAVV